MESMGDVSHDLAPNDMLLFAEFKKWKEKNQANNDTAKYNVARTSKPTPAVARSNETQRIIKKRSFGEQLVADETGDEEDTDENTIENESVNGCSNGEGAAIGDFIPQNMKAIDDLFDVAASKTPLIEQMGIGVYNNLKDREEYKRQRAIARAALEAKPVQFIIGSKWTDVKTKATRQILINKVKHALAEYNYTDHIILAIIISLTKNKRRNKNRLKNMLIVHNGGTVRKGRPIKHGLYSGKRKSKGKGKGSESSYTSHALPECSTTALRPAGIEQEVSADPKAACVHSSFAPAAAHKNPVAAKAKQTQGSWEQPTSNNAAKPAKEDRPTVARKSPWLSKPTGTVEEPMLDGDEDEDEQRPAPKAKKMAPVVLNIMNTGARQAPVDGIPPAIRKRIAQRYTPPPNAAKEPLLKSKEEYFILVNNSKVVYSLSLSYKQFRAKWNDQDTWYRFPALRGPQNLLDDEDKYKRFLAAVEDTKDVSVMWVHSDADYMSEDDSVYYEAPKTPYPKPVMPVESQMPIPVPIDVANSIVDKLEPIPLSPEIPTSTNPAPTAPTNATAKRRGRPKGSKNKAPSKRKIKDMEEKVTSTAKGSQGVVAAGDSNEVVEKPKRTYKRRKRDDGKEELNDSVTSTNNTEPKSQIPGKITTTNTKAKDTSTQKRYSTHVPLNMLGTIPDSTPPSAQPQDLHTLTQAPTTQGTLTHVPPASVQTMRRLKPKSAQLRRSTQSLIPTQDYAKEDGFAIEKILGLDDPFGIPAMNQNPPAISRKSARRPVFGISSTQTHTTGYETPRHHTTSSSSQSKVIRGASSRGPPLWKIQAEDAAMPPPGTKHRTRIIRDSGFTTAKEVYNNSTVGNASILYQPLTGSMGAGAKVRTAITQDTVTGPPSVKGGARTMTNMLTYNVLRQVPALANKGDTIEAEVQAINTPLRRSVEAGVAGNVTKNTKIQTNMFRALAYGYGVLETPN